MDSINRFRVQTRLLFSKTLFLLLAAMFAFFTWGTIEQNNPKEGVLYIFLLLQSVVLSILVHMDVWEKEREEKTFEMLIMRIPNLHSLIWFKLRVSLFWTVTLTLPFFAGYLWFYRYLISPGHMVLYFLFCQMMAVFAALLTCVTASFVHRALPTGIIVIILIWILYGFTENAPIPFRDYYRPFMNPCDEKFDGDTLFQRVKVLLINRIVLLAAISCFYWWFYQRLKKIERWIG